MLYSIVFQALQYPDTLPQHSFEAFLEFMDSTFQGDDELQPKKPNAVKSDQLPESRATYQDRRDLLKELGTLRRESWISRTWETSKAECGPQGLGPLWTAVSAGQQRS